VRAGVQHLQARRDRLLALVAAVDGVLEQVALPRRFGGGVDELDDVAEAIALAVGVILQQRALGVQVAEGVLDAALDRLGQVPAVPGCPVGQQLAGLVGTLQHGGDDAPVPAPGNLGVRGGFAVPSRRVVALVGVKARLDELGRADDRRGPHVAVATQPREEVGGPLGVLDGELPDELGVAVVAVTAALVEGVLADHVGDCEQEQLGLGVAEVAGRALGCLGALARADNQ
jgi:hypothetical protein